jgi:hypothetical protein
VRKRPYLAVILIAVSFIATFGGALRLAAEVLAKIRPADFGSLLTPTNIGFAIASVIVMALVFAFEWRWAWLREQLRLNQEGIRALNGRSPSGRSRPVGRAKRRIAMWSALRLLPSILVGIALPGPAAAAAAILTGVVLYVVAGVAAATST